MYSATCEAFLESRAERVEGVAAVDASYVSESVSVRYDPERTDEAPLCGELNTLGYDARSRADGDVGAGADRNRGIEDVLGFRYAAGVVFGAFLLVPYVALFYPGHLLTLLGMGGEGFFGGAGVAGKSLLFLPVFLLLTGVVVVFTGLPMLRGAVVALTLRRPNTDLLVATTVVTAYAYSAVAFLLGRGDFYFDLAVVVAASVVAAAFYESLVKRRALDTLTDLTASQVREATVLGPDDTTRTVPVDGLGAGDRVLVREGERVPVDARLAEGHCTVDESVVTGESLPVSKTAGDRLVGGSVITDGGAVGRVGDDETNSSQRLTSAVWRLQSTTHGVQRRADRLAALLFPAVVVAAVGVGVGSSLLGAGTTEAVLAGLLTLLVATPWALGLATPLSVATSVAEAVERGIVVLDESVFERLRGVDVVVFDKTGTLTTGEMRVVDVVGPDGLLSAAAALERRASHPAAVAIAAAFDDAHAVESFESHTRGVEGVVDGSRVLVGHPDLFAERDWALDEAVTERVEAANAVGQLPVVVGRAGVAEAAIVVADEPRDGWREALDALGKRGLSVVVLTGDDPEAAAYLDDHDAVSHVFAGVSPDAKTAAVRRLQADHHVTVVGDGTNDAPALAAADLGISLGSGTALASEAADITIVDDDLRTVGAAFDLAMAARRRLRQNGLLALGYNALVIPAAALGLLNPLVAAVAVGLTSGLVVLNNTRSLIRD